MCARNRANNQNVGECATFLKDGLAYREVSYPEDMECIIVEICSPRKEIHIKLINLYNLCRNITVAKEMAGTV